MFSALQDGGIVLNTAGTTSGSRADVFLHSKWSYSLMGLYELPWQVSVAGTLYGRQGYPSPAFVALSRGALGSATGVLVDPDLDATRLDNVHILDFRVQKAFEFANGRNLTFDVDFFNVANSSTTFQENRQANTSPDTFGPRFHRAREIIAPRLVRFGLRFRF
jgi:hypothetical protein